MSDSDSDEYNTEHHRSKKKLVGDKAAKTSANYYNRHIEHAKDAGKFIAKSVLGTVSSVAGGLGLSETYSKLEELFAEQMNIWEWLPREAFPPIVVRILTEADLFEKQVASPDYFKHLYIRYQETPEKKKKAYIENVASIFADMRNSFDIMKKWRKEMDEISTTKMVENYEQLSSSNKQKEQQHFQDILDKATQQVNIVANSKENGDFQKYLDAHKDLKGTRRNVQTQIMAKAQKTIDETKVHNAGMAQDRLNTHNKAKQDLLRKQNEFKKKIPLVIDEINSAWTQISNLNNQLLMDMLPYPDVKGVSDVDLADFVNQIHTPKRTVE